MVPASARVHGLPRHPVCIILPFCTHPLCLSCPHLCLAGGRTEALPKAVVVFHPNFALALDMVQVRAWHLPQLGARTARGSLAGPHGRCPLASHIYSGPLTPFPWLPVRVLVPGPGLRSAARYDGGLRRKRGRHHRAVNVSCPWEALVWALGGPGVG